jgi:hypothetical protein
LEDVRGVSVPSLYDENSAMSVLLHTENNCAVIRNLDKIRIGTKEFFNKRATLNKKNNVGWN